MDLKLPLLSVITPQRYVTNYMTENKYRLIGAYDIHRTIRDLASRFVKNQYEDEIATSEQRRILNKAMHSYNFLAQTIPANRPCNDAGISTTYCACNKWTSIKRDMTDRVKRALLDTYITRSNRATKGDGKKCHVIEREHVTVVDVLQLLPSDGKRNHFCVSLEIKVIPKVEGSPTPLGAFVYIDMNADLSGADIRLLRRWTLANSGCGSGATDFCVCTSLYSLP